MAKERTGELMAAGYIEMDGEDKKFADTILFAQKEIL